MQVKTSKLVDEKYIMNRTFDHIDQKLVSKAYSLNSNGGVRVSRCIIESSKYHVRISLKVILTLNTVVIVI